jgi:hypothetical protein
MAAALAHTGWVQQRLVNHSLGPSMAKRRDAEPHRGWWLYMYSKRVSSGALARRAIDRMSLLPMSPRKALGWRVCILCLLALGSVTLGGCDDIAERHEERAGFWGGNSRGESRGDRDGWHRGPRRGRPPRASNAVDAGPAADAGDAATSGAADASSGPADASPPPPTADAGLDPTLQALSDGQIVLVVDVLLEGSIDQASVALPRLADADVLAYAERVIDEDAAARDTLAAAASATGDSPADSLVSDQARTTNQDVLSQLVEPDAGAIDFLFITTRVTALTEAVARIDQLRTAADAPVLQAQLVVLHAIASAQLEDARRLSTALEP